MPGLLALQLGRATGVPTLLVLEAVSYGKEVPLPFKVEFPDIRLLQVEFGCKNSSVATVSILRPHSARSDELVVAEDSPALRTPTPVS